jgi:two-component system CheB/CheR fusion protein
MFTFAPMGEPAEIVVGIGASAGGLDAFHSFFKAMPSDSGMAFVVVLHLPANRKSMLPEILGRWTSMAVVEAQDGGILEANHVYVPPPHANTTMRDGRLRLQVPLYDAPREERPIDGFFDSLAANLRQNAIGIILSGTGTDGALGLKAIRENGGFTLAQGRDGSRPQFDGMPSGAIATGAVDLVVSVEDMPEHLMRQRALATLDEPLADDPAAREAARLMICAILRAQIGHDFGGYKDKTFMRRVQRRMHVLGVTTVHDYITRLEGDHDEVTKLFRDLLIRVTSFFRDGDTFSVLEQEVIPRLFKGMNAEKTVRVWVPGCATGEEAYSLAILLREQAARLQGAPKLQIFATDIDEPALDTARTGRYPATLLEGLSPARRARFFTQSGNGYVVTREIREICTFSAHSLVRDPPFSRMNLISCRNLLIYLDTELQARVIPAFHYSLVPHGMLLLGSSETTARHEELFTALNKGARIFERRDVQSPRLDIQRQGRYGPSPERPGLPQRPPESPQARTRIVIEEGLEAGRTQVAPQTKPATAIARIAGQTRRSFQAIGRRLYPGLGTIETLQKALFKTEDQLQALTEEHSTAVEELRSANEELHSVNEELQSTIEELETSKEEIQSVNEELHTVNSQLSEKVDELDRANSDLKNLFDSTEVATVFLDRHLIIRGFTPAVSAIYNLIPSDQGRPLTDIVSRLRYDGLRGDVAKVLDTLEPLERRVTRDDGKVHFIMRVLPYRGPDSTVDGTLVTFLDVSSIVEAETHQRLLVDELNHRVKNMLTVVVSLAAQTLRRSDTLELFSAAFMGRVQALTASYTLLSQANWVDVSLREVLLEEIRPFTSQDSANFIIQGPSVRLAPQGALAFGMAVHELATNAVKFGALSRPEGIVRVTWRFDETTTPPQFVLTWVEENGPEIAEPSKRGFGMTLIERGFAHELSGEASVAFSASGVRAQLTAPLGESIYAPRTADKAL